ncbi:MAG: uroporphyrinogen-III synthase [Calditrichaeota bacterium]|nr:uroporphyrinogen-III synthase [Calditrichota bacterium]
MLLVRPPELCSETIRLLSAEGIVCHAVPATTTQFVTPEAIDLSVQWIAFTSANGVHGFFEALNTAQLDFPIDVAIAVVGEATAAAVRLYFAVEPELISCAGTGAGLAREMLALLPADTAVLYPCPEGHESEFAELCTKGGLDLRSLPVYKTVPRTPDDLNSDLAQLPECYGVVFFAPSAVRAFHAAQSMPWNFTAIAIGETTAAALRDLGHSDVVVAARPTAKAVADAVRESLLSHEPHHD